MPQPSEALQLSLGVMRRLIPRGTGKASKVECRTTRDIF
jgi:hypothetical protein